MTMAIRISIIASWMQLLCAFTASNGIASAFIPIDQRQRNRQVSSRFVSLTPPNSVVTSTSFTTERSDLLQKVLSLSRWIGPVGAFSREEDQTKLLEMARQLPQYSDTEPARYPLRGVFDLVYSSNPGPPSGRLVGPFYGKVTQTFLDDNEAYINTIQAGPLEFSFQAEKKIKDDWTDLVSFRHKTVKIFGQSIQKEDVDLEGVWKYLFLGTVQDSDGRTKLVRVMETPSLLVLEQLVPEE